MDESLERPQIRKVCKPLSVPSGFTSCRAKEKKPWRRVPTSHLSSRSEKGKRQDGWPPHLTDRPHCRFLALDPSDVHPFLFPHRASILWVLPRRIEVFRECVQTLELGGWSDGQQHPQSVSQEKQDLRAPDWREKEGEGTYIDEGLAEGLSPCGRVDWHVESEGEEVPTRSDDAAE